MELEKQQVEEVAWEDVRRDCKYPREDNNEGYTYGLNLIWGDEIVEVQWFVTRRMRAKFIIDNDLELLK